MERIPIKGKPNMMITFNYPVTDEFITKFKARLEQSLKEGNIVMVDRNVMLWQWVRGEWICMNPKEGFWRRLYGNVFRDLRKVIHRVVRRTDGTKG